MTTSHSSPRVPEEPHGHSEPMPHHTVPYFLIFFVLVALTAVTVGVAFIRFQSELVNVLLALLVASVKGLLVAAFFMHVKFEGKLIRLMLAVPLVLCVLIIVALIPDIVMTKPNSASTSLHLFNWPAMGEHH